MGGLLVIAGTPAPDTSTERTRARLRTQPRPAQLLQCPRCASRELIETRIGVQTIGGRPCGGTRQLVCFSCHGRGERVVVA